MIKLKQVIHYPDTNSVEATWVDETTPAIEVPESIEPDTVDEEGNVIAGVVTPAHAIPAIEVQVKCHSYADVQMDMLRADLGADAAEYTDLITLVESNIQPVVVVPVVVPPISVTPWQIRKALNAMGLRESVETAVVAADTTTQDAWQYATSFVRTDSLVVALGSALGKTETELDALFELAETL